MSNTSSKRRSYIESQASSQSSDSNFELERVPKTRTRGNINFEKNYPKNILISIIASLDLMSAKQVYLDHGISEEDIQQRNSASLHELYTIITHPAMKSINTASIEILASNILLQNSKISKKAFHLEILRDIFSFDCEVSQAQFKLEMKKRAKKNCTKEASDIQIFQYQSSTIYLLTMFCKAIENNPNRSEQSLENKESTEQQNSTISNPEDLVKSNKKNNRQLLKPLIHLLCSKLNKLRETKKKFSRIYDVMQQQISQTENQLKRKLNLREGVPHMRLFFKEVIRNSFEFIREKKKISFSVLETWIKSFEKLSLINITNNFKLQIQTIDKPIEDSPMELDQPLPAKNEQPALRLGKQFWPVILIPPC